MKRTHERMRILSALRASLCERICKVDEEIASILRDESRHTRHIHQDSIQMGLPTRSCQEVWRDNIGSGNNGQILTVLSEQDYCRIALTEF